MDVAIIDLKDIFKYLVRIIIIVCLIIVLTRFFKLENIKKQEGTIKETINIKSRQITNYAFTSCLDLSLSVISYSKTEAEMERISLPATLLNLELGMLDKGVLKEAEVTVIEEIEATVDGVEETQNEEIEAVEEEVIVTQIIAENNVPESSTHLFGSVHIRNESNYQITEEMMMPDAQLTNKKDVFIYHAHTCESYTISEEYYYEMTGNFRTIDLDYTVARVGRELKSYLEAKGFNVIHDTTYHDYPTYSGSYTRALETAERNLTGNDIQLVLDLHRDALGSNSSYAPTVKINDVYAAQLMFVIGTDGGGLKHPNWVQNLKIAVKIQEKANEMYPGLFRPILIRNSRYNQHVATGASIIEVGATGNTLDQTIVSMQFLAKVLEEVFK